MDRARSLRILGLPTSASDDEIRVAYWSLRAHVELRLEAAGSGPRRDALANELAQLEPMGEGLAPAPPERRVAALGRSRTLIAIAAAGVVLAALLLLRWEDPLPRVLRDGEGGAGGAAGLVVESAQSGEDESAAEGAGGRVVADRVRVVADAGIESALLEVVLVDEEEPIASGPADDRAYWLGPGQYTLRVSHPDCEQDWQQGLTAVAGDTHEFVPRLCGDTSWLVVHANTEAARVEVDGNEVGASGSQRHAVAPGERQVRVVSPGFEDWEGIVELEPGRELRLQPRLARASPRETPPPAAASALPAPSGQARADGSGRASAEDLELARGWHHETRQWLLARYDLDRSGDLDQAAELAGISCEYWQGIERSYDASRLGLPLTRMYGFDGDGWKNGRLGIDGAIRDLAFQRMRECGLRY